MLENILLRLTKHNTMTGAHARGGIGQPINGTKPHNMSDKNTKELGYVELEWTCPTCKTRNPGTAKICSGCGAAQPQNVQFEAPAQAELIKDQDKIAQAKAGPDIHCAFCGARNPAGAKVCHQCGADLSEGKARQTGQVVGAYNPNAPKEVKCPSCGMMNPASARTCSRCGAPLVKQAAPQAAPVPAPAGRGNMGWLLIAVIVLVVVGLGAFVFMGFRTSDTTAQVSGAHWERSIDIVAPVPVRNSAWRDQLPAAANNVSCRQEFRYTSSEPIAGSSEVCGTPYTVDTGTGIGRVVQDCEYRVFDDMCSYTTLQLGVINTVVSQGEGFAPKWPVASLAAEQKLGDRHERYVCEFSGDGSSYSYTVRSLDKYEQCQTGSRWKLQVNSFGDVVAAELAD
jgi:ribosomal protein L40E